MSKKKIGIVLGIILVGIIACISALFIFYQNGFAFGTWINGVYCTGKSVREINEQLMEKNPYSGLTLEFADGSRETLKPESIGYAQSFTGALEQCFGEQKTGTAALFSGRQKEIVPDITWDEEELKKSLSELHGVKKELVKTGKVSLDYQCEEGYRLINEKETSLDFDRLMEICRTSIKERQTEVFPAETDCFVQPEYTKEDKEVLKQYQDLETFLSFEIQYKIGEDTVLLDKPVLFSLLSKKESGEPKRGEEDELLWDDEKIALYIDNLAEEYDTYGKPRNFHTTAGRDITIEKGNYGNQMNRKEEVKFLKEALNNRQNCTREPEYVRKAWVQGKDDIGNTYIEIDMGNQKMYFYVDGECYVETEVVTGNMVRGRDTPEGIYFIYAKQRNRTLRGPGYAAFVRYWMPVKNGVGIHDALWRDEFGGEIYKREGSHGCINTPLEAMEKIYDKAEIGMPVIMFY